jgi:signal peptidase I
MSVRKGASRTGFGIVLALLLAFAIFFYLNFHTAVVSGHSMDPTFHTGQRLLVSRAYWLIGPIRDNDVVVVRDDSPENSDGYIIKRVYKMGGEKVDWLNKPRTWLLSQGDYTVPQGKIYLMGDNRDVSSDSREFGPVDIALVLGKVVRF